MFPQPSWKDAMFHYLELGHVLPKPKMCTGFEQLGVSDLNPIGSSASPGRLGVKRAIRGVQVLHHKA
jgi:hypothetical protein